MLSNHSLENSFVNVLLLLKPAIPNSKYFTDSSPMIVGEAFLRRQTLRERNENHFWWGPRRFV
jgi:hypothetical protein